MGADTVCSPLQEHLSDVVKNIKQTAAEVVIDYVGNSKTLKDGYRSLRKKGKLIIGGLSSDRDSIPISSIDIVMHEIEVKGAFLNPFTFPRAIESLHNLSAEADNLDLVYYSLSNYTKAIEDARSGKLVKAIFKIV